MELKCAVQTYDWGRKGEESIVARLAKASSDDFVLEEEKSYAELWMGTHQNGPSCLKKDGTYLKDHINKNKSVLGVGENGAVFQDLPFLFKILSVGKALSIQAHPDKKRAERLHVQQPEIYKDSNHKPELAIALSNFEALCGFRPINEIKSYINDAPEISAIIRSNCSENLLRESESDDKEFLRISFQRILSQKPEIIRDQLNLLIDRLSKSDESTRKHFHADLLERLHEDFPGDVGCLGIYFFNYVTLQPGEAIYIAANEPHAYLSGDCIECMACSDNVVRAGLTPKLKDVPTLIEMLTYSCESASSKRFEPTREDQFTEVFRPPVPDFAVARIHITERKSYDLIPRKTASIMLVFTGRAEIDSSKILQPGSVLFVSAGEKIHLQLLSNSVTLFQAFANITN